MSLKSERLEVFGRNEQTQRDEVLREIPIRDLDRLILVESVQITSQAMARLMRAAIPVNFLGWNGEFLGGFLPAQSAHGLARLKQYERTQDAKFGLQMAGRIVTAKIYNQRRVLQRVAASRKIVDGGSQMAESEKIADGGSQIADAEASPAKGGPPSTGQQSTIRNPQSLPAAAVAQAGAIRNPEIASTLAWMEALLAPLSKAASIDEVRGYEGTATARYFQAWAAFLPEAFPFERRSKRPPLNPVNACISFGATLLYTEMVAFIHAHGLDPSLGLLHATEDGRWSLGLDLIEPFRPVLVEALALDLFSHQILNERHFEPKNGGVYLNEDGRKKFIFQYERRMERQFMSESAGHRTALRQQLENQAVMYKSALEQESRFEPFLMN